MALFLLTLWNTLHVFLRKHTAEEVVQDLCLLDVKGHSTTTTSTRPYIPCLVFILLLALYICTKCLWVLFSLPGYRLLIVLSCLMTCTFGLVPSFCILKVIFAFSSLHVSFISLSFLSFLSWLEPFHSTTRVFFVWVIHHYRRHIYRF